MCRLINVTVPNRAIFMHQQAFDTFEINGTRDPLTFANITAILVLCTRGRLYKSQKITKSLIIHDPNYRREYQ